MDDQVIISLVIADIQASLAPQWLKDVLAEDFARRDRFGVSKYGASLSLETDIDAEVYAHEEVLDLMVYAKLQGLRTGDLFWGLTYGLATALAFALRRRMAHHKAPREDA